MGFYHITHALILAKPYCTKKIPIIVSDAAAHFATREMKSTSWKT
jgi:hypothetical protein